MTTQTNRTLVEVEIAIDWTRQARESGSREILSGYNYSKSWEDVASRLYNQRFGGGHSIANIERISDGEYRVQFGRYLRDQNATSLDNYVFITVGR